MTEKKQHRKGRSFWIVSGLQALMALFIVVMGLAPPLQRAVMNNMHLSSDHYAAWVLLQTVPKMYNFDNEVWRVGFTFDEEPPVIHYRVNHYPLREVTFNLTPNRVARHDLTGEIWARSTYRNTCVTSAHRMAAHSEIDTTVLLEPIDSSESILPEDDRPRCP